MKHSGKLSTAERRYKILSMLSERGSIRVEEIGNSLGVGQDELHEDLTALKDQHFIEYEGGRVWVVSKHPGDVTFADRMLAHAEEKQAIGRAAAELIEDGDTIFLASGSTVYEVAKCLLERQIRVISNSLPVLSLLSNCEHIELISVGGALRRSEMSFIGQLATMALQHLEVDKAVVGVYALDPEQGIMHNFIPETMTDRSIIDSGNQIIVVADHSKFQRQAPTFVAPFGMIDLLVTDRQTDPAIIDRLLAAGVRVIAA